jgi:hypothetical protein
VTIEIPHIDSLIKDFDLFVKNADKILSDAINTGIVAGRTKSLYETRQTYNMKAKDLKNKYTKTIKANPKNDVTGYFILQSQSISLIDFGGKQLTKYGKTGKLKRQYKKRTGIVRSGASFKILKKKRPTTLKQSWVAQGRYGEAIWRQDPSNPRKRIYMASLTPTTMYKKEGLDTFVSTFYDKFFPRLRHQLLRLTTPD